MALLYPRQTGALRPIRRETDRNYMNANDRAYVQVLRVQSGALKDVTYPSNRFSALSGLTAGTRTGTVTQIRGGSV